MENGRRYSVINLTHSGTKYQLRPKQDIGKGGYGNVRLFQDDNIRCAVKSFQRKENCTRIGTPAWEHRMAQQANPCESYTLLEVKDDDESCKTHHQRQEECFIPELRLLSPCYPMTNISALPPLLKLKALVKGIMLGIEIYKKTGVLHLDINPGNILVSIQNNEIDSIKLIDWGLAVNTEYYYMVQYKLHKYAEQLHYRFYEQVRKSILPYLHKTTLYVAPNTLDEFSNFYSDWVDKFKTLQTHPMILPRGETSADPFSDDFYSHDDKCHQNTFFTSNNRPILKTQDTQSDIFADITLDESTPTYSPPPIINNPFLPGGSDHTKTQTSYTPFEPCL